MCSQCGALVNGINVHSHLIITHRFSNPDDIADIIHQLDFKDKEKFLTGNNKTDVATALEEEAWHAKGNANKFTFVLRKKTTACYI